MLSAKIGYFRPTAFTPRSIAGLTGWWDAADAATVTLNGSTVSQWRDKSGNGYHMSQSTAANQPTYASSVLNGKSGIQLAAGQSNRLNSSVYMDSIGNDTSRLITIMAVLKSSTASINNKTIGECDNASGFGWYHRYSDGNSYFDAGADNAARTFGAASSSAYTNGAIYVGRRSGATVNQSVNGTTLAGASSSATGGLKTGNYVFCVRGGALLLTYCEVITYNAYLSNANVTSLLSYLGTKYGITVA